MSLWTVLGFLIPLALITAVVLRFVRQFQSIVKNFEHPEALAKTLTDAIEASHPDVGEHSKTFKVEVSVERSFDSFGSTIESSYPTAPYGWPQFITLERLDRSERLKKNEVVVDRHGIDAGKAFPLSMASFGIAVSAASSPTPESYDMSVGAGGSRQAEIKSSNINGYHVDAFRLVTGTITEILKAWNQSDEWVPVYSATHD